jgi:hypothetical protein
VTRIVAALMVKAPPGRGSTIAGCGTRVRARSSTGAGAGAGAGADTGAGAAPGADMGAGAGTGAGFGLCAQAATTHDSAMAARVVFRMQLIGYTPLR